MILLDDAADAFLSDPRTRGRLKPSTIRAYRKDLAAVAGAIVKPVEQITTVDLSMYLDREIAPSTAARRLAALRGLFGWALREEHINSDPTAVLEAPAVHVACHAQSAPTPTALQWSERSAPPRSRSAWR